MQGHFKFSDQVTLGYFEQDLIWDEPEQTPIQIVSNVHPDMVIKDVRKHLARCGISSKHAMQAIGTLSGGEQAKVKMCLLTLIPCKFSNYGRTHKSSGCSGKGSIEISSYGFCGYCIARIT